jgi:type II secretory pathway pseudopilin PulG
MKTNRTEKGQALVLIAFGIIALLAMTGLAVDASATYSNRQDAQNAADSAALASALDIVNSNSVNAKPDALSTANTNGFNNDGTTNTVTVGNPGVFVAGCNGQTPSFTSSSSEYVQVIIKTTVNTTFGSLVGVQQTHNSGAGIVALSKTACPAINLTSTTINVQGGGIFDNSSCSTAFDGNWGNKITTNGGCIGVVGGLGSNFTPAGIAQGAETITGPGFCSVLPVQITPDFSMVPAPPTPPTCSGPGSSITNSQTGVTTVSPGTLDSISIGYTGANIPSGVYCITSSSSSAFYVTGGATVTGGDVTFVFTNPSGGASIGGSVHSTYNSLQIYTQNGSWSESGSTYLTVPGVFRYYATGTANYNVAGGSTQTLSNGFFYLTGGLMGWQGSTILNLHAPTTGPYANIAIFSPISNATTMTVNGGSTITVYGTILHPGGEIHLNGSSTVNVLHSQVVGNTITTQGGSIMNINYSAGENISPPSTAATVELIK